MYVPGSLSSLGLHFNIFVTVGHSHPRLMITLGHYLEPARMEGISKYKHNHDKGLIDKVLNYEPFE
jgi:hypothetical protein